RQPRGKGGNRNRKGGQAARGQQGRGKFNKNRGPKPDRDWQSGGYSAGKAPRPRKSLENSPFAALAALKAGSPKPTDKADEPAKTDKKTDDKS
ncbi:MAG: hypothetical protein WBF53_13150, partial [Litorimonas sp.]